MNRVHRLRLAVVLCATLAAASCASPDPKLYTIAPLPGAELSGAPKVVALHTVGTPRYLQRNQIVRSSEDYRLDLRSNEWWGEPLDAMLGRVLMEDLTQRLPQSTIYTSSGAVTGSPDATIEVQLQRLDLDRTGNLLLIAQGSVSFKNKASPNTRNFHISQPLPSPGAEGQVAATSVALAQVADRIAGMLANEPDRR
ncbi:MAG: PqiC family protein [Rhodopila sp.]|nr:PqiC family protein [Rhodopila sp.]